MRRFVPDRFKTNRGWRSRYLSYLQSKPWKQLRGRVIERDGGKCVGCGCASGLSVHHKFYRKDFEDSKIEDLVTLCRDCHRAKHPDKRGVFVYSDVLNRLRNLHVITGPEAEQLRRIMVHGLRAERRVASAILRSAKFFTPHVL